MQQLFMTIAILLVGCLPRVFSLPSLPAFPCRVLSAPASLLRSLPLPSPFPPAVFFLCASSFPKGVQGGGWGLQKGFRGLQGCLKRVWRGFEQDSKGGWEMLEAGLRSFLRRAWKGFEGLKESLREGWWYNGFRGAGEGLEGAWERL